MKSLASVLAKWQGGIRPKPGTTDKIKDVPETQIVKAYGYIPKAVSFNGGTAVFKKSRPGYYEAIIYWEK